MSWRDAPLHVEATSLCQDVLTRSSSWAGPGAAPLAAPCAEAALALGEAVALALTFPEGRAAQLQAADEAVVRLRERLRLAGALGLLSPGALRQLTGPPSAIGRMIGGWRRRLGPHARAPPR